MIRDICQGCAKSMKFSDVLNPRITSRGTRENVVNTTAGTQEYISVSKEFHEFLLQYNVAMWGKMEGDDNTVFHTSLGILKENASIMELEMTLYASERNTTSG